MSKNKPMTRIDLDYNKNLKYPDINDYLNDTIYASNLTQFPDNQSGARTSFRLIPGTTEWNWKINIAGFSWRVFLGQFKLYGYNPDLEAIEQMRLTIDFVNNQNNSNNYVKVVRKRGTPITFNVITPADPETLPLVGAVNYFINFTPSALEDIYDYVFSTRWVDASEHYQKKVYTDNPSDAEKVAFVNYIKYRIYNIKIPISIQYYYVNATEAGGVLEFDMSLIDLLPTFRNSVDFSSKRIELNPAVRADSLEYLKLSYTSSNSGNMQLKGAFVGNPNAYEIDPLYRPVGTTNQSTNTSIMVKQLMRAQHSGFDLSYPAIKYTYDFFIGVDSVPILNDEEFDTFQPSPRDERVDPLTITSYKYGHKVKLVEPNKDNPFQFTIEFTSKNRNILAEPHKYKFQLNFLQRSASNVLDANPINSVVLTESAFIASDFSSVTGEVLRTNDNSLERGTITVHRSNTVIGSYKGFRMFSQRVGTKDGTLFAQEQLSQFTTKLEVFAISSDNTTYSYRLTLTWPTTTKLQGLYNIVKAETIRLSIANAFQEIVLQGTIEKNTWDPISEDLKNPAYNSNLNYFPKYLLRGVAVFLTPIESSNQYPAQARINSLRDRNNNLLIMISNAAQTAMYTPNTLGPSGTINLLLDVQNYVYNGVNTYATTPNPFFFLEGYIVIAHRLRIKSGGFDPNATFRVSNKDKLLRVKDFLKCDVITNTNTVRMQVTPKQLETAACAALSVNKLEVGEYTAYIVTNLSKIPTTNTDLKLYTNSYVDNKIKCDLVIGYRWSKLR
jgi:hypothetical protein